jgi:polyhydroxybutyrate depolymerase
MPRALILVSVVVAAIAGCKKKRGPEPCDPGQAAAWSPHDDRPRVTGPSRGCPGARVGRDLRRGTVTAAGRERTYLVEPPYALAAGAAAPLIFVFHGRGASGTQAYERLGMPAAVAGRAVIAFPDAQPVVDYDGRIAWDLRRDGPDLAFFDEMLAKLGEEYCIDLGRVFATGHSAGGWMTNRLGFTRTSRLRGIAPVAGAISPGNCGAHPLAAMIIHGWDDVAIRFAEGKAAEHMWSTAAGCRGTTHGVAGWPCVAHDGCAAAAPVLLCPHDRAHAWPPFAAPAIWAFFDGLR